MNLLPKIQRIVAKYIKTACGMVEQQYTALPSHMGQSLVYEAEVRTAQDCVARSLCAIGQKAWIAEYGRGSLMETKTSENPFLEDYVSGRIRDVDGQPLFNKDRLAHAFAIVGREHGYYYDIDGRRYHSHGNLAGKVVENFNNQKPLAPQWIIKHILFGSGDNGIISEMNNEIADLISDEIAAEMLNSFPKEIKIL